ncbi:unnamed protein product [Lactuca virosa]|uniref:Uncharacterized protein n=1 Tax=Lactuca virosa TaxID=75947 RepID=A0AAU9PN60_9ASTR|nr:unnamed protein product [Lactuca virosa]
MSLRIFLGLDSVPNYTLADISEQSMLKMHVKPETSEIRPYVVCVVLRGITFSEARYNSFIDLQDKLHQNICSDERGVRVLMNVDSFGAVGDGVFDDTKAFGDAWKEACFTDCIHWKQCNI